VNEAALLAARRDKTQVEMSEFNEATERVIAGPERRSRVISEEERNILAYHEAGHALVGSMLPDFDATYKVTILPRGMALGATMSMPEKDEYYVSRGRILAQKTMALGGRVAEEIFCRDITSGAQMDLEQATKLARYMVTKWGMSEKLGPVDYGEDTEHMTLAKELAGVRPYSEATAVEIDNEVRRIITDCMAEARTLVQEHKTQTEVIAKALLQYETLDAEDVEMIMQGKDLGSRKQIVNHTVDGEHKPPVI
jgi:cell division protease FtsH